MKKSKKSLLNFGTRSFILTTAIIVILGGAVSGIVAWMFIKSDPVHNTFSYGDMKIELKETDTGLDDDDDDGTNEYSLKVGATIAKDPIVTVEADSLDCWLFVKVDKSENFDEHMEYDIADGWSKLSGEDDVYYRQVSKSNDEQTFNVLEGNVIKVKEEVTQEMLDAMKEDDYPTIGFTAYAVQLSEVDTAKEAWDVIKDK